MIMRKYRSIISLVVLWAFTLFPFEGFLGSNTFAAIPGPTAQELSMVAGILKQISKLAPEPSVGKPQFQTSPDAVTFTMQEPRLDSGLRRNDEGFGNRQGQAKMRVIFDAKSDTVKKRFQIENGQDTVSFTMELDKGSVLFKQFTARSKSFGHAQVYQRSTDTIIYFASQSSSGAGLKEWIQATAFNHPDNLSQYTWKFSADAGASITLKQQSNGSVNIYRTMKISGIDNSDPKKRACVMDAVRKALKRDVSFGDEKLLATLEPLVYWTNAETRQCLVSTAKRDRCKKTASYTIIGQDTLVISIKEPLSNYPLLIDPSVVSLAWGFWLDISDKEDRVFALAVNGSNIYVGGAYSNSNFVTSTTDARNTGTNGFVMKIGYDSSTSKACRKWSKFLDGGATSFDRVTNLVVNGSSIYAGGESKATTNWSTTPIANNWKDISCTGIRRFVIKIVDKSTKGDIAWGQWLGDMGQDRVTALAVSGTNIYVAGGCGSSTGWSTITGLSDGWSIFPNGFVIKISDETGKPVLKWGQWLGGNSEDRVFALAVNGSDIYVGGRSVSTVGWGIPGLDDKKREDHSDGFVIKISDETGNPVLKWGQWLAKTGVYGTGSYDQVTALVVSGKNIYVGGGFFCMVCPTRKDEGFVAKIIEDSVGKPTLSWMLWLGGDGDDRVNALSVKGKNIYVGGVSKNYLNFNTGKEGCGNTKFNGTNSGITDEGFVMKIIDDATSSSPMPTIKWLRWLGDTGYDQVTALAVYSNNVYVGGVSNSRFTSSDNNSKSNWKLFSSWSGSVSRSISYYGGFVAKIEVEPTDNKAIFFGCNS